MLTGYARTKGFGEFPNPNWGVLIRMDRNAVLAPIHELIAKTALAALVVLAPMLGLLFWTSRRLRQEWVRTRQSEAWLSTTLSSIGDAVMATDGGGSVTFMNRAAESFDGLERSGRQRACFGPGLFNHQ